MKIIIKCDFLCFLVTKNKEIYDAYHLRTCEPEYGDPNSKKRVDMNSIFVPDRRILKGIIKLKGPKNVRVINYTGRDARIIAYAVVDGERAIKGRVVSSFSLTSGDVEGICTVVQGDVVLGERYGGRTRQVLDILRGKGIERIRIGIARARR